MTTNVPQDLIKVQNLRMDLAQTMREAATLDDAFRALNQFIENRDQRQQGAEPDGEWVMVPREPTSEMINAANYGYENGEVIGPVSMYAAMLSAAPAPALCTPEEAADLACELGYGSGGCFVLSDDELAAIINADRAKR
jgi:hypothetical protein